MKDITLRYPLDIIHTAIERSYDDATLVHCIILKTGEIIVARFHSIRDGNIVLEQSQEHKIFQDWERGRQKSKQDVPKTD